MNPITEESGVYYAYLLRLWRVRCQGHWQWRASLESPHTGERQSFASLEQCFTFLRERCSNQSVDTPEAGKELKHEKSEAE